MLDTYSVGFSAGMLDTLVQARREDVLRDRRSPGRGLTLRIRVHVGPIDVRWERRVPRRARITA